MAHYLCRIIDADGKCVGTIPIIGSSDKDAVATARTLFRMRRVPGGFELWHDDECFLHEAPPLDDEPLEPRTLH